MTSDPLKPADTKTRVITWAKAHPIIATIAVLFVIGLIAAPFSGGGDEPSKAADDSKPAASKEPSKEASEPTPSEEPTTPTGKIEAAIDDTKVKVAKVELDGENILRVEFKVRDNISNGTIRTGIAKDTFAIAEAVDKSGVKVRELRMRGLFPLKDKYGNTKDGQVFFTTFLGSDLSKINYDDIVVTQFDNIESLAVDGTVMLNPGLR